MTTPDTSTPAGQVRLLINDLDADNTFFDNAEVEAFLDLEGESVKRAAALALETIASNEALVSKVIRTQDVASDGTKVSAELRARAKDLREQAEEGDDFFFDVVEFEPDWFGIC